MLWDVVKVRVEEGCRQRAVAVAHHQPGKRIETLSTSIGELGTNRGGFVVNLKDDKNLKFGKGKKKRFVGFVEITLMCNQLTRVDWPSWSINDNVIRCDFSWEPKLYNKKGEKNTLFPP